MQPGPRMHCSNSPMISLWDLGRTLSVCSRLDWELTLGTGLLKRAVVSTLMLRFIRRIK